MSDKTVLAIGILIGFVVVPPMARAWPVAVNGFLFLILFASLLMHRDRWLPYLEQFSDATRASQTKTTTATGTGGGGGTHKKGN